MSSYQYQSRKNQDQAQDKGKKSMYSVAYNLMAADSALYSSLQSIDQNKGSYDTNEMLALYSAAFMGGEL